MSELLDINELRTSKGVKGTFSILELASESQKMS